MTAVVHPSVDERIARGRAGVSTCLRRHTPDGRQHPIVPIRSHCSGANATRHPDLVPVRHGRMLVSPFTFYRGAAKIMATDLNQHQQQELNVRARRRAPFELRGFASPERTLLFGLNDFDETLPGPFEYDVKRMAASLRSPLATTASPRSDARRDVRVGGGLRARWPSSPRCVPWTSGTHACRSKTS